MMNFQKKLFLSIVFPVFLAISIFFYWTHLRLSRELHQAYLSRYSVFSEVLGKSLIQIESNTDQTMYNAAQLLQDFEAKNGLSDQEVLRAFAKKIGITHIFITDAFGKFVRSTNEDPSLIPNVFSFCGGYRELLGSKPKRKYETTPIIPPAPEPQPYKFLLVPNKAGNRILEVGYKAEFIGKTLMDALGSDSNILEVSLFAPDGTSLGSFGPKAQPYKRERLNLPVQKAGEIDFGENSATFTRLVPANDSNCCECKILNLSRDDRYYYILKANISTKALQESTHSLTLTLFGAGLFAFLITLLIAGFISSRLVQRIHVFKKVVGEVFSTGNLKTNVPIQGADEIAELAGSFNLMLGRLEESQSKLLKTEKDRLFLRVTSQVAHDIRSPLAALSIVEKDLTGLDEEKRLLVRSAVNRIKDIANNLLSQNRLLSSLEPAGEEPLHMLDEREPMSSELLPSLIEPIITEKRMQFRSKIGVDLDFQMDAVAYGLFANVQPGEFRRLISNLIGNAMEAVEGAGKVIISLSSLGERIQISLSDNGKGIPSDVLEKLGELGATFGKVGGFGFGLYHARTTLTTWGGELKIESSEGHGTTVKIVLPAAEAPVWFMPRLMLRRNLTVVVLDDDTSIHQIWRGRFESLKISQFGVEVVHVSTPAAIRNWVELNPKKSVVYLVDYELLGHQETGLSLIEELGIRTQSILVTGRFEQKSILKDCLRLGIQMVPKGMAGFIPIEFEN